MFKIGIISNEELVNLFGSEKNKKYFYLTNNVNNTMKETLLKRAYCVCEIIDLGCGEYEITKIRENKLPQSFYSLNKSLYKYLAPIILKKILYDYHQDNALVTTNFKYANIIGMINKNYTLIKKYKTSAIKRYGFDRKYLYEYYSYVDDSIKYYIKNSLELLKKCDVLKYDEPYMIIYRKILDSHDMSKVNLNFKDECKVASFEEIRHYTDIEESIKKEMQIENDQEAYFSHKTKKFKEKLLNKLKLNPIINENGEKIIILLKFKGYRIWYTTIEKCENLLKEFSDDGINTLIENFNEEFIEITLNNLKNRISTKLEIENFDKLITDYTNISRLTLDYLVEDIELDDSVIVTTSKKGENHFIEILTNEY